MYSNMDDYDKSLDDIIRQRNIGIKRANKNVGGKKSSLSLKPQIRKTQIGKRIVGVGRLLQQQHKTPVQDARQKLLMNQRLKVKDAREMLLQKNRLVDARQKLNQKAKMTDAREKLNKLASQQSKTSVIKPPQKQPIKRNTMDLTRTVSNVPANRINSLRVANNNNLSNKMTNAGKQVVLTDGGLTIITRPSQQKTAISSPPTSLFTRTVDSLAKDVVSQSGLLKRSPFSASKKRQLSSDESEDSDDYSSERVKSVPKKLHTTLPVESVEVSRGISTNLQSRLGKQLGGQHGYRIIVTNLHPLVSERDLEDLFGDIGPISGAQILQEGVAEVIYQRLTDAEKSVEVYHKRELDGKPMGVKLVNMAHSSQSPVVPSKYIGSVVSTGTLHSDHIQEVAAKSRITPDVGLFHKALFRSGASSPAARTHAAFTVTM